MPDTPPDPKRPAKRDLPARRAEGAPPRAFADQTAEPIALPDASLPLPPPPQDLIARRNRASLPTERKKDRALPSLTPAPYQTEPTSGSAPAMRADLPGPRRPDELPKFRPPAPPSAEEEPAKPERPPVTPAQDPAASSPRPAKHRIADNRVLEFKRQDALELDPEVNDSWGQTGEGADVDRRSTRRILAWAALVGAPLAAFALWQSLGRPGTTPPPTISPETQIEAQSNPAEESRQAAETVRQFLATKTVDDRAAFVRHPEATKPRMAAWYSTANPVKPLTVVDFRDRTSEQTIGETLFLMLTMETSDRYERAIALERLPDGRFLVDWESYVFWSNPRWQEFLSKEPEGSFEFRVSVSINDYFNYGYADPKKWFCYKLEDPEQWAHCWGYCPIDSEAGLKINRLIRRQRQQGQDTIKAILKVKFEQAGKGQNQVLIEDLVEDGWIKPGP